MMKTWFSWIICLHKFYFDGASSFRGVFRIIIFTSFWASTLFATFLGMKVVWVGLIKSLIKASICWLISLWSICNVIFFLFFDLGPALIHFCLIMPVSLFCSYYNFPFLVVYSFLWYTMLLYVTVRMIRNRPFKLNATTLRRWLMGGLFIIFMTMLMLKWVLIWTVLLFFVYSIFCMITVLDC